MPSKISLNTGFPRKDNLIFKTGSSAVISKSAKMKRIESTAGTSAPAIAPESSISRAAVLNARVENKKLKPKMKLPEKPASMPFCASVKISSSVFACMKLFLS